MEGPEIRTQRLRLARFQPDEADRLAGVICAEPEAIKTMIGDASTAAARRALAARWVSNWEEAWREHGLVMWSVWRSDAHAGGPGDFMGYAGFSIPRSVPRPELTLAFHPHAWGRGFATEAARAAIAQMFRHGAAIGAEAFVFERCNQASCRVLAKLGFRRAGAMALADYQSLAVLGATLGFEIWRLARLADGRPDRVADEVYRAGQLAAATGAAIGQVASKIVAGLRPRAPASHIPAVERAVHAGLDAGAREPVLARFELDRPQPTKHRPTTAPSHPPA